jgi:hypothetical protein
VEEEHLRHPESIELIRRQITRGAIEALSMHLGGLTEGRKTLILVSGGFGLEELEARDILWTANQANVALYPLDPRGLVPPIVDASSFERIPPRPNVLRNELFRRFASETGGVAIVDTNDFAGGLDRAARDSSAYYLLAYESPHPNDGKYHRIKVDTTRKRLNVRARAGYRAFKEEQRTSAVSAEPLSPAIDKALAQLTAATHSDDGETAERVHSAATDLLGTPMLSVARGRDPGVAAARPEFPRAGVLVVRASVSGHPAVTVRLLGRDGRVLTELPVDVQNDACEARLALPAIAQGDYIFEMTAQLAGERSQQYVAFRVTR